MVPGSLKALGENMDKMEENRPGPWAYTVAAQANAASAQASGSWDHWQSLSH